MTKPELKKLIQEVIGEVSYRCLQEKARRAKSSCSGQSQG